VLVIDGADGVLRLPALDGGASRVPEDGKPWSAAFAWVDRPVAFDHARLELGSDVHLDLPAPDAEIADRRLDVHVANAPLPAQPEPPEPPTRTPDTAAGVETLRLKADLLEAREEARELRSAIEHTTQELTRAREDLSEEQERRAGDGKRFSDGLAQVREAAEEALATEQATAEQLRSELRQALEAGRARDEELADARARLESAAAERAEGDALRSKLAALESAAEENQGLRAELQSARDRAEGAQGEMETLRTTLDAARGDVEHLLSRLNTMRDASGAER
jgi:hypothetical protein